MSYRQSSELALHDLLIIEDHPALMDFRCSATDLPLWPQVRVAFFRMMMSDLLYDMPLFSSSNVDITWPRSVPTMLRSLAHNLNTLRGKDIRASFLITAEGVADQCVDGQLFNRLSDYFVAANPADSLILFDHFEWRWPFPRFHGRLVMHAPWQAMNAVVGKMREKAIHRLRASELVGFVSDRAQRHVGWNLDRERREALVNMLARKIAAMPWQYSAYTSLLRRVRPELLMVGAACYGPAACLISAAKSLQIRTAEYQHGCISAGHDAYNFAPAVLESEVYQRTLPEYFLSYGQWWNDQINAPVIKLAIGNPHRSERLSRYLNQEAVQKNLLILSDGIEFNLYLDLARALLSHSKRFGLTVVLRPHPLERTRVLETSGAEISGVHLDTNIDLYQSLMSAHTVISEVSTGLFEAAGLAKRIFVWDTAKSRFSYPNHPFESFHSIDQLLYKLERKDCDIAEVPADSRHVWCENWNLNFLNFLSS
jgi:hypothetical protein